MLRTEFYGNRLSLKDAVVKGMQAAMLEWPDDLVVPPKKEAKNLDRVLEALAFYVTIWNPETDYLQPVMEMKDGKLMPAVERTFSIPLPILHPETGEPFIYAGRYDLLGEYRSQLVIDDEKTTSQLGDSWAAKWNMWGQFTGYCWAAREYGKPVIGALVRGISFLKNTFGHQEVLQLRDDHMINSWYQQLIFDVEAMKNAWTLGWFNQNFADTCAAYGGCGFQTLCQAQDPEQWIEGRYGKRHWNPLSKVPVEPLAGAEQPGVLEAGIQLPAHILAKLG